MSIAVLHPELRPLSQGYGVQFSSNFLSTDLKGGAPRRRVDFDGTLDTVSVTWALDPFSYDYLQAFKRIALVGGVLPFVMELISETASPRPYTCYLVPNSFGLTEQRGLRYTVSAQLMIEPLDQAARKVYDDAIIMLFDKYGQNAPNVMDMLHDLIENRLPTVEIPTWTQLMPD